MSGVVRSANAAPGGMLLKPVLKVWVKAARGGAASGKESLPLAMKRAVEMGAIIFLEVGTDAVGRVGTRSAGGADRGSSVVEGGGMGRAWVCGF